MLILRNTLKRILGQIKIEFYHNIDFYLSLKKIDHNVL